MFLSAAIFPVLLALSLVNAVPNSIERRADTSLVGYYFVHFYDRDPSVYAHLSNGNNPLSYSALNKDQPIAVPTLGTKGARDPYIIAAPDKSKYWILATDLKISTTNWDAATRTGSRSIFVWESTDLVNWGKERLVQVAPATAGMVWAPEAVYAGNGQYFVHWSSRFYSASDPSHTGAATTPDQIWYAYTSDFITFTEAKPYITLNGTPVIDLTFLPLGGNEYIRYIKNETVTKVWAEYTNGGIFGSWQRLTADNTYVISDIAEGPLAFWDNQVANKAHIFLDLYISEKGYAAFETGNVRAGTLTRSSTNIPKLLKHGTVLPVNQAQYNRLTTLL